MTKYHVTTEIVAAQRAFFSSGATCLPKDRLFFLKKLKAKLESSREELMSALCADLGKCSFEAYACEYFMVMEELKTMLRHTKKWSRPVHRYPGLISLPGYSTVYTEPHGVVLVMSPWNYPLNLSLTPVVSALAAGNTVILKPSNYSPAVSTLIQKILESVYPPQYVSVLQGGRETNAELLDCEFDYIFFTGSPAIGKIVMEKAARHLTPITLELGGKSPCIVDDTADLAVTATRLVWGKLLNSSQTCIAPDYVLVKDSVHDKLIDAVKAEINLRYGIPLENPEYPHIISKRHFDRAVKLLESAQRQRDVWGGDINAETLQMAPALVKNAEWDDAIMQEELFCPILPFIVWHTEQELFDNLLSRPRPLALYLFSKNRQLIKNAVARLPFGGGCINDTILHITSTKVPFGGTGNSGMGCYHGKYSFDTFSRKKTVLKKPFHPDIKIRYAPFSSKYRIFSKLFK